MHSCTIITGEPNKTVSKIHDRMPVMLPPSAWDRWLDPEMQDTSKVSELLVPVPDSLIEMYPVSTDVNNVRNKGASLRERVPPIVDLEPLGLASLGAPEKDGPQATLL
jgi:putative SOS response-associated peptidase YedK